MAKLTNQRTKELLIKVLNDFKNSDDKGRGICYHIEILKNNFDIKEVNELAKWFVHQKPRPRKNFAFTKDENFYGGMWWWYRDNEGAESRIKFLEFLIQQL